MAFTKDDVYTKMTDKCADSITQFDWNGPNFAQCPTCGAILDIGTDEEWPLDWTIDGCPECGAKLPDSPSPYFIDDWFADNAPIVEYIVDTDGEYLGALIHHTFPKPWEGKPHIWTDTRAQSTFCTVGEKRLVAWIQTLCYWADDYIERDYKDMRNGTRTFC